MPFLCPHYVVITQSIPSVLIENMSDSSLLLRVSVAYLIIASAKKRRDKKKAFHMDEKLFKNTKFWYH
jgi:hypothetical protein